MVLCPSANLQDCDQNWNSNLILFIDNNRNRRHEANEQILEQTELDLSYGQLSWRGSLGMQTIAIKPNSGPTLGSMGSFYYCSSHVPSFKKVVLNKMALTRIETLSTC